MWRKESAAILAHLDSHDEHMKTEVFSKTNSGQELWESVICLLVVSS